MDNCAVCFEAYANSVFLPCGHGGLCFDCSIEIVEKGRICYLCRTYVN